MPITIDITKSEIYQEGKQSGLVEGKRQAIEGFLRNTKLTEHEIAYAIGVSLEYVQEIKRGM